MVWPVSWIRRRLQARRERRRQRLLEPGRARPEPLDAPEIRVIRNNVRGGDARTHRCTVRVRARVELSPETTYRILTSPENYKIFKNERSASERRVVFDDGVKQQVELTTAGHWKFLRFSGSFPINLVVDQDAHARSVAFRLLSKGFMDTFEGSWSVSPSNSTAILSSENSPAYAKSGTEQPARTSCASIVTLEQRVHLAIMPPRPLDALFYRIVGRVARNVLRDLQDEAKRVNAGHPTITLPAATLDSLQARVRAAGTIATALTSKINQRFGTAAPSL
mmetsp:Transcript_7876/g.20838  ORF Transcript_7876/g.20838 Transcript_7876/m.20838 type:complete len:279 (-) Transcript_7876:1865-2701(-)